MARTLIDLIDPRLPPRSRRGRLTTSGDRHDGNYARGADVCACACDFKTQDAWTVISAYFAEKGLVRQQLDSFDEFIQNTMQELVDDSGELTVKPETQYTPGQESVTRSTFAVLFNQVYVSKPTATERDGTTSNMFPHEARLRNMTYSSPMYVDISCVEQKHLPQLYQGCAAELEIDGDWYPCVVTHLSNGYANVSYEVAGPLNNDDEQVQVVEEEGVDSACRIRMLAEDGSTHRIDSPKEFLGYVPIMLRSRFCVLADKSDKELCELGECIYDQGGYFVINGSEKVVVAQERMSNNHVYCFRKKQPHKSVSHCMIFAELRWQVLLGS